MGGRRHVSGGFSLVELFVVLGALAVLIALLLPAVGKAREQGRRAVCASNLRQVGVAARAFALDHDGLYPMCYGTGAPPKEGDAPTGAMGRHPMLVNRYAWLAKDDKAWRTYGTPWQQWAKYGAVPGVWKCPSSEYDLDTFNGEGGTPADTEWGEVVRTDYMYVGGLTADPAVLGRSVRRWGTTMYMPTVSIKDLKATDRVLAADAVFYAAGGRQLQLNHPRSTRPGEVDAQAVLYADGHVTAFGREMYDGPLAGLTGKASLRFDGRSGNGFFFFGIAPPVVPPTGATPPPGPGGGGGRPPPGKFPPPTTPPPSTPTGQVPPSTPTTPPTFPPPRRPRPPFPWPPGGNPGGPTVPPPLDNLPDPLP